MIKSTPQIQVLVLGDDGIARFSDLLGERLAGWGSNDYEVNQIDLWLVCAERLLCAAKLSSWIGACEQIPSRPADRQETNFHSNKQFHRDTFYHRNQANMGQEESHSEGLDLAQIQELCIMFMRECPSGALHLHEFKRIFGVQSSSAEESLYIETVFNSFDTNRVKDAADSHWRISIFLASF